MIIMKSLDLVIKMYVCVKKIYACLTVACYELKTTKTTKKQIVILYLGLTCVWARVKLYTVLIKLNSDRKNNCTIDRKS